MKIIGIESRISFCHQMTGMRQFELALHPLELVLPDGISNVYMPITVHTSLGDRNGRVEIADRYMERGASVADYNAFLEQFRYGSRR